MTTDLKPATVIFEKEVARSIQEYKYYYGFIKERASQDHVEMEFLTHSYSQFAKWIITFTDQVQVVSPGTLQEKLQSDIRKLTAHYL